MTRAFLEAAGLTDAGALRQFNEDRIVVDPESGVMVVADGMGGHRAGEVASHLAADVILTRMRASPAGTAGSQAARLLVNASINQANQAIVQAAAADTSRQGMGTTLAMAYFHDNAVVLGHVGDCRIYRLRGDVLSLLTRDDSLIADEVERGLIAASDAVHSHNRNLVTQALGVTASIDAHVSEVAVVPGDVFLLCSDGLNDMVGEDDLALITSTLAANLPLAVHTLVQVAKDNGGYDNVSAILVRVVRPFPARESERWFARLLRWFR